jgi:adenine-specific DNA-methyltransferase
LHIIGLTETKEGGKKLIGRNKEGERHSGTILEEAIIQLDSLDKLNRIEKPSQFGHTQQERLFNVALELSITWINRILFLKLLEAQLITYHKGNKAYSFLNLDKIKGYDDLNGLFFQVLARKHEERNEDIKKVFDKVPYLNSSLFEPTDMEQLTLFISNLKDNKTIPIISSTVLKDQQGNKRTGNLNTLEYLFEFLNAYDFGSEGSEDIQEDNKTLISASVLGLIFEKINGYKDGSFFTPGFITMYMCRETIRKAVVQKFNDTKKWNCTSIEQLYDKIEDRQEANSIVNSIKICDPAVGSGHFLVSALNEMIAVKNDLKILQDRDGKRLKEYHVEVINDELIVTDEDGDLFEYNPNNKESQRIQETIFHEKQTIIENCLFGVDINTNSVKICRLRLWIELLKNAYYKTLPPVGGVGGGLETLPNIDINIKCGNSLVSRFAIDADLKQALKKSKWTIDSYRIAVDTYRNAENKEQKREMERLIADIKSDFRSEISLNDPKLIRKRKLEGELFQITNQQQLFEMSQKEKADWNKKVEQLTKETETLAAEIEAIKANKIFENAFEWRFEFPEVLNDEGDFVGFDVVIGNPPYIQLQAMKDVSEQLKQFNYQTYEKTGDIYALFYEKGNTILKHNGYLAYITSNKWMRAGYGKTTRNYFLQHTQPQLLIDLGSGIFEEATVDSNILIFKKQPYQQPFAALDISKEKNTSDLQVFSDKMRTISPQYDQSWTIASPLEQSIKAKIEQIGKPLKEWDISIYRGILTGFNEAFIIDGKKKDELIAQDPKSAEIIKPILRGRDIKRYKAEFADLWLINIPKGFTIKGKNNKIIETNIVSEPMPRYGFYEIDEAWSWFEQKLPAIAKYLNPFKEKAKKRLDMGDYWWELRACTYLNEFEKEKIVWNRIASEKVFSLVEKGIYISDSMHFFTGENLVFLNCILNSKLYSWFLNLIVGIAAGGNAGNSSNVKDLHVLKLSEAEQAPFIELVEQILLKKEQGEDTKDLETQIDRLVYELYDLTEEEIKIIAAS